MKRYAMLVAYDGSKFYGWQIQPQSPTIQEQLQFALRAIFDFECKVIGAGRTDSGVHAMGQVAHFDAHTRMTASQLTMALRSKLPPSLQVISIAIVDDSFHARYDAIDRTYKYIITSSPSPFDHFYKARFPRYHVDYDRLLGCIPYFLGVHDFTSFAKPNPEISNYVCEIKNMEVVRESNDIIIRVTANRFLHNMVRRMVGAMLSVSHHSHHPSIISSWIDAKKHVQNNYITAHPNGLYLENIRYPKDIFLL
jgi:tRNA pseudouridine38-40 synthase